MPTVTIERFRNDGPFRVGVRPTGPKHVAVAVELSDAEHQRLLASER